MCGHASVKHHTFQQNSVPGGGELHATTGFVENEKCMQLIPPGELAVSLLHVIPPGELDGGREIAA